VTLLDEANALRQSIEELARDESAGAAHVRRLADAARSLGRRWAATAGNKPATASMLTCFTGWLDLEEGFCAGVREEEDRAAEDDAQVRSEAREADDADYRLARELDALLATQPALAAWCVRHRRAAHVLAWPLFDRIDDPDHRTALFYVAETDAEIDAAAGGGLRLRLPGDVRWIHGTTLVDLVQRARASMRDR